MFTRIKKAALPLSVLAVGIGVVVLLNATKPNPESATQPPRPLSVHVEPAVRASTQLMVDTHGEVRATVRSEVVTQVAGRVMQVSPEFVEGGIVRAGEPLLIIDDTDYRAEVEQAESRLAGARVELEQALADAQVARKQLAHQSDPSPLALKKPQVARARAGIEAAEANLALARANLERTRISLPFDGRITGTQVDLGQFVAPGKVVAEAFASDRVEIRLPLTDSQLGALGVPIGYSAGSEPGLPVDLVATVAGQQHRWSGRVTRLDAVIDPRTRVIYATAEVANPYDLSPPEVTMPLAVGLFVNAAVAGRIVEDTIQIPSAGLRAGDRVFVLDEDGRLDIRNVDVLHSNTEQTVLASGVDEGDRVIVSAIRNPINGMRLEAIDPRVGAEQAVALAN